MQQRLCAAILLLEAVAFGLSTPVLTSVEGVGSTGLWIGLGLTVACLVVASLLRYPWGLWLGWVVQVAALAVGFVVSAMFFLGAVFLALWATAFILGRKIEVERAQWEASGKYPGKPDGAGS